MKLIVNILAGTVMALVLCSTSYAEDSIIIELRHDISEQAEVIIKKAKEIHNNPQAQAETKQWAKEARRAPAGSREHQYAHAKYVEARLTELGPRIQILHDIRESLPNMQATIQRLGSALERERGKLGLDEASALNGTLEKTKTQLEGMRVIIDQLSSDPALANSAKFQTLTTGFRNGVARIASRRNGDAFNTKGLAEIADVLDSYRLLVEVGWMRLEEDYNRLKTTNIRGNTSAVLAETHKALTQLPGVLDDPSADEARALDQDMYESSGYEFDAMPSKGKHYDSNSIREMIENI